jgi:threonine synthase
LTTTVVGSFVRTLRCVSCQKEFNPRKLIFTCDKCGEKLDVVYDYDAIGRTLRRTDLEERRGTACLKYHEMLPIFDIKKVPSLGEGGTPLIQCRRLGEELGLRELYGKDETRNPTGVFKDRASIMAVNKALEFERKVTAIASTGNAAASMAAHAAKAGLQCNVFVPESTPIGKLSQSISYGARVIKVKGNYDQAYDLANEACEAFGWYNCNPATNPFRTEGKKTTAYELCEQFNWEPPDWVIVPIGNGCNLAGVWKGFKEFYQLGFISKKPRMIGIQPTGSSPVVTAYKKNSTSFEPVLPDTVAGALAVGKPRNYIKTFNSLRESNGVAESVTDDEILEAQSLLASKEGIFAEPGGAAPVAGVIKLIGTGVIGRHDKVCCVITGNGLKDPEAALRKGLKPSLIEPTLEALRSLGFTKL